jgi:hypothetical protein
LALTIPVDSNHELDVTTRKQGVTGTADVIAYEPDLLFSSKIEAAATKAGLQAKVTSNLEELLRDLEQAAPRVVFLNLDVAEGKLAVLEGVAKHGSSRFVGYYSHVNTQLAEEARRIGISVVISRGAFVTRLPEILKEFSSD